MNIKPGKYRHFKGKDYQVIGTALHSETLKPLVIYKALYDSDKFPKGQLWVRPIEMFFDVKEINGKKVRRFEPIFH